MHPYVSLARIPLQQFLRERHGLFALRKKTAEAALRPRCRPRSARAFEAVAVGVNQFTLAFLLGLASPRFSLDHGP